MTIESIILFFCKEKNITFEELISDTRRADLWRTRYMIMHYCHYGHGFSANKLSRVFRRNRRSVFRGIQTIRSHMQYHKNVKDEYTGLIKKMEEYFNSPIGDMEMEI